MLVGRVCQSVGRVAHRRVHDFGALLRAIDSGQDRWVIESLAQYFRVSDNLVRALWRNCPAALGAPPEWHLRQILLALNERPERNWPSDAAGWLAFKSSAVPAAIDPR